MSFAFGCISLGISLISALDLIFHGSAVDDAFATQPASEAFSLPSIYAESNGQGFDGGFGGSDDPTLPPPSEMLPEEGLVLRKWRRQARQKEFTKQKALEKASGKKNACFKGKNTPVHLGNSWSVGVMPGWVVYP
ncbi:hypothetical protein C1H46_032520 [Malus baccata]|uniref:BZIP domain-containing protein n=1 Tax=Malus baccata TaxID=106549 RepID=A0A540L602_MALBA|nr:hypothetical protein C1H46_032520 [Malus baccata]